MTVFEDIKISVMMVLDLVKQLETLMVKWMQS